MPLPPSFWPGQADDPAGEPLPSVKASTQEMYRKATPELTIDGAYFKPENTKLKFDPPLPEGTEFKQQVREG